MSESLVLDDRCRALRRRLGPLAWVILEEAALTAEASVAGDSLWCPLSVRKLADGLGLGREAAARGLGMLVSAGLLRRTGNRRGASGRFVPGGYGLELPSGMAVTGLTTSAPATHPESGGPRPGLPATVAAGVAVVDKGVADRHDSGRRKPELLVGGQASLFAVVVDQTAEDVVAEASQPVVAEPVGAVSSGGCEVVNGVLHELAPGVPVAADPGLLSGGGARC